MSARKYFAKSERSLLRWDVDDSNNTMDAFHWASLVGSKIPQKGAPNVSW
jgi:hypothetical protein